MLHEKGERGQIATLPEWLKRAEDNPMGWGMSRDLKGVIFGKMRVHGEAKDDG
jgi:hypothetical protein